MRVFAPGTGRVQHLKIRPGCASSPTPPRSAGTIRSRAAAPDSGGRPRARRCPRDVAAARFRSSNWKGSRRRPPEDLGPRDAELRAAPPGPRTASRQRGSPAGGAPEAVEGLAPHPAKRVGVTLSSTRGVVASHPTSRATCRPPWSPSGGTSRSSPPRYRQGLSGASTRSGRRPGGGGSSSPTSTTTTRPASGTPSRPFRLRRRHDGRPRLRRRDPGATHRSGRTAWRGRAACWRSRRGSGRPARLIQPQLQRPVGPEPSTPSTSGRTSSSSIPGGDVRAG